MLISCSLLWKGTIPHSNYSGINGQNLQAVITTRVYVLHKITIVLKFMSYINSNFLMPAKKLQIHKVYKVGSTRPGKWVASNMTAIQAKSRAHSNLNFQLTNYSFSIFTVTRFHKLIASFWFWFQFCYLVSVVT